MNILFVHPEDQPQNSKGQAWDWIMDLGWVPSSTYDGWMRDFRCLAEPLSHYHHEENDLEFIQKIAARGGNLVDEEGINWWELFLLYCTERIDVVIRLKRFIDSIDHDAQFFFTRDCFEAEVVNQLRALHVRSALPRGSKLRHYIREISTLPSWQIRQIFWDKYDPDFALRSHFMRSKRSSGLPVVLIPSTYVNSSRTAMGFASRLPQKKFLLVTTRASGEVANAPKNVEITSLGAYAGSGTFQQEYARILTVWEELRRDIAADPDTSVLESVGVFNGFPHFLKCGLGIRNAWLRLFDREVVDAVLSCDNTPFTLLPVLLAKKKNIPTVSSHHGALDWRYRILPAHADVVLAKGKMEKDYLTRVCGVLEEKIAIGAPVIPSALPQKIQGSHDVIVFFSEAYEAHGGRADEIYKEIVVPLVEFATSTGRQLIIKLHPFESVRKRQALLRRILSDEYLAGTRVLGGPLTQSLLEQIWFGVTVLSTVAMECTAAGVPCFLCKWLEYPHHGYGDQFYRFKAGHALQSANEIQSIPALLEYNSKTLSADNLWQAISSDELAHLFIPRVNAPLAVCR